MTGDAVRQRLAETSERIELGNERQQEDDGSADAVMSAWSMFAVVAQHDTPRLVAALTVVLDLMDDREKRVLERAEQQRYPNPQEIADALATVKVATLRRAVAAALEEQP